MIDVGMAVGFTLTAVVIIVVPGPSVLFVVSRAVSYGRRTALITVLGNTVGTYLVVVAVSIGLGAIVERSAVVFTVVKLIGAAYLVFLGVQAIRHRHRDAIGGESGPVEQAVVRRDGWRTFRAGLWVGCSNPKSFVLFGSILPQFVDPTLASVPVQMMVLGLIAAAIGLGTDTVWGLAAGTARTWFDRSPRRLAMLGGAGGVLMIGLGANLAFSGKAG